MPIFRGGDFELQTPWEYVDLSTYAYTFPARGAFQPSVVVKWERVAEGTGIASYAAGQMDQIRAGLPEVEVVSGAAARHREWPAYVYVYSFGEARQRMRQMQRHILVPGPPRVATLTATTLEELYPQTVALFEAVFDSFRAVEGVPA